MKFSNLITIAIVAILLSGCAAKKPTGKTGGTYPSSGCEQPLSSTLADKIVVDRSDRAMYLYKNGSLLGSMKVSLGENDHKGSKVKRGDRKSPIGTYKILNKRCHSVKYMAMTISYPNAADRARAAKLGVNPGSLITIHGQPHWNANGKGDSYTLTKDWTEGCVALTNSGMRELWSMIKVGTPITLQP
ncbi:MAG: L,D-transpeptidase family protein [Sulfurovum sp.]|nr:L,D-transpeptidase family protein [Sulfurovum sp.]